MTQSPSQKIRAIDASLEAQITTDGMTPVEAIHITAQPDSREFLMSIAINPAHPKAHALVRYLSKEVRPLPANNNDPSTPSGRDPLVYQGASTSIVAFLTPQPGKIIARLKLFNALTLPESQRAITAANDLKTRMHEKLPARNELKAELELARRKAWEEAGWSL